VSRINSISSCIPCFRQVQTDLISVLNNIVIFTLFGILWGFIAQVYSIQTSTGNTESLWDTIKSYHLLDNVSHAIIQTSSFWIMYLIARYRGSKGYS